MPTHKENPMNFNEFINLENFILWIFIFMVSLIVILGILIYITRPINPASIQEASDENAG